MSWIIFLLSLALVLGVYAAERELTRHSGEYPWIDRIKYEIRPVAIAGATLALGLLVWAIPPHCDAIVGTGGVVLFLGCWMAETRKKPVIRGDKNESLLRLAHPLGR